MFSPGELDKINKDAKIPETKKSPKEEGWYDDNEAAGEGFKPGELEEAVNKNEDGQDKMAA